MEISILSVLGTGLLLMLAVGSIIILVHSYSGTDTKRRLTRLEDGQAKLEGELIKLKVHFEAELKEIKLKLDQLLAK